MHIYLDVETIPSQDPAVRAEIDARFAVSDVLPEIKAAANLKDPEKIAADIAARTERAKAELAASKTTAAAAADKAFRDLALNGATAHLAAISFAIDDETVQNVPCISIRDDGSIDTAIERHALDYVFRWLETVLANRMISPARGDGGIADDVWKKGKMLTLRPGESFRDVVPVVVAHHAQFDIRMIWQRAVILGVPVPDWWPVDARPWDRQRIIDTMTMWAGERDRVKLDALCKALGLPGKADITGAGVYDAILAGRLDDVVAYCGDDVRRLRCCHHRMIGLQPLPDDISALTTPAAQEAA